MRAISATFGHQVGDCMAQQCTDTFLLCSEVQCSAVQCSAVQCSAGFERREVPSIDGSHSGCTSVTLTDPNGVYTCIMFSALTAPNVANTVDFGS